MEFPNGCANISFIERLYTQFLREPSSVSVDWQNYFRQISKEDPFIRNPRIEPSFPFHTLFDPPSVQRFPEARLQEEINLAVLQERVDMLIRAYRVRGHMAAHIDPLGQPRPSPVELDPSFYGFTETDMERRFSCRTLQSNGPLPLREIIQRLRNTYCRSIGVQFMHIDEFSVREWLQRRMESTQNHIQLSREEQIRIFTRLTDAVTFEEFIRKEFIGAKSFSLEGSESLIPLLDLVMEQAGRNGIEQVILAMAHRGRLNVLVNIMGKSPRAIFQEFRDVTTESHATWGDVKYHLGYDSDWSTSSGRKIHLTLCFNPSHLEFVNPVAVGRVRARQDQSVDEARVRSMAVLIHGDAAFAGEGIIQETLNLSQLEAYRVGGTLHVIVNNQIGFTTSPEEGRSSVYATDVAKMLQIPIFHVNGEDPEAVAQTVSLAMDFRKAFRRDVVIDMYGYRRLGHNEGDEPSFTQPLLYRVIGKRQTVRQGYLEHLLKLREITRDEAEEIARRRHDHLAHELSEAQQGHNAGRTSGDGTGVESAHSAESKKEAMDGVSKETLSRFLQAQTELPSDFHPHPKITRGIEVRRQMARGERPLDWSAAEALAFASLAVEGVRVRLTGQDSARGTFSQRHAVFHDIEDGHTHIPLQHIAEGQAPVEICNSPLSEAGVLGFEYGYSLDCGKGLVLWEAQFGDFVNAAQVIVDQFITSAEEKWRHFSGIVLLLPHAFEGMGPEHSSARLERFLQLAAENNIWVVSPSTPAQYYHCLRRQIVIRPPRPLIVMTPKSLLRHPEAVSSLEECANGGFQKILRDSRVEPGQARTILLCSGKIFYDLEKRRKELKRSDAALLRLEQFYPFPHSELREVFAPYPSSIPVIWVQEEPENMGAWYYLHNRLGERLLDRFPLQRVCREASASPATGSARIHRQEQEALLAEALGPV